MYWCLILLVPVLVFLSLNYSVVEFCLRLCIDGTVQLYGLAKCMHVCLLSQFWKLFQTDGVSSVLQCIACWMEMKTG